MALLHYAPVQRPAFEVLYQDNDIVVLNKPSGLLSVPGKAFVHKDSLQTRVQRVWPTATIVHRLDMATSGIMIMALNKDSHRHISKQFETRMVSKTYYANIYGIPTSLNGTIELPLICDWPNRPKQMVDYERGKHACTHYEVINQHTTEKGEHYSFVKLTPVTGRSHQLRVHMLALGHPILGDRLYAHQEALNMSPRLCLHASFIEFAHPSTGKDIHFSIPPVFTH